MGFDVIGKNQKSETGKYFRNNIWWWRPLWTYVCENCEDILSIDEMNDGNFNGGALINKTKAESIAERLNKLIENGEAEKTVGEYEANRKAAPLEKCYSCDSIIIRNGEIIQKECNACNGTGKVKSYSTRYPMSLENIKKFAVFCENSGGFNIC